MIIIKHKKEIERIQDAGHFVARVLDALGESIQPGMSTWELEVLASEMVESEKVTAAFKGYRVGKNIFPCCLCISINEEVVHGIPSKSRILEEGDLVSIDFGVKKNGFFADSARTFPVGKVSDTAASLLKVTNDALFHGISKMVHDLRLQDIGFVIQRHVESHDFSIVRDFVGHGIGRNLHEEPQIPNYGKSGKGLRLKPGMVFAIEPMVNVGSPKVEVLDDGWTVVTEDRSLSAHFEHTVAITSDGPLVLTI